MDDVTVQYGYQNHNGGVNNLAVCWLYRGKLPIAAGTSLLGKPQALRNAKRNLARLSHKRTVAYLKPPCT